MAGSPSLRRPHQSMLFQAGSKTNFMAVNSGSTQIAKALVLALRAAGRDRSRADLVRSLGATQFDLGGVGTRYRGGDHEGSRFVDLSMVARDGRFLH